MSFINLATAKKVAPVVGAAYLAQTFTASQSKLIQGAAMLAAGMVAFGLISSKL